MWNRNDQTICAIATPHGSGGISVIRVSGPQALEFVSKRSPSLKKKKNINSHTATVGFFVDSNGQKLDEVVFLFFEKGKSFTGEEVVEISCHGNPVIARQILNALVEAGCKIAEKGEFTYRAFMNGRLDLVQAEAVLSLIESKSEAAASLSLRQLEGKTSEKFEKIVSDLTWCLAHIEASIDFIEQGVSVVDNESLIKKLTEVNLDLKKLIETYTSGRLIKDGVKIALLGQPNAGKSSLLNLLLENERAIVTPIAGTTRDVVDGETIFNKVKFNISDTAGIRDTSDQIEKMGIDRSKNEALSADIICLVVDATEQIQKQLGLVQGFKNKKVITLFNKADLISEKQKTELLATDVLNEGAALITKATEAAERKKIFELILKNIGSVDYLDVAVISSSRQYEQAVYGSEMISKTLAELENNTGTEFVAMYLKDGLISLQKILGQAYDDQIMDRVFKEFCLGK